MAAKACALGATDSDLADLFDVAITTIDNWKLAHPEFMGSLKLAKDERDTKVEHSLFERATGYEHRAVKIFNEKGVSFEHEYIERYPPDTTAMIFWLKNRQPAKWRDRQEVEHSGKIGLEAIVAGSMNAIATSNE
jgi:hypothetical protein